MYSVYILLPAQQNLRLLEQYSVEIPKTAPIVYQYISPAEQFFDNTPIVENVTTSIQAIFDVAKKYRITINEVAYKDERRQGENLVHYNMNFSVEATYPKIKAFIVDVLAGLPYVALEQLAFERDDAGIVSANLRFTLYMVHK